jgi:hypothetical protein
MGLSSVLFLAFAIGIITGLRSMTAPAAVSWAARIMWLNLAQTPLAFLGYAATPFIFTVLAIGELVVDKLPRTPSRKKPGPFVGRVGARLHGCPAGRRGDGYRSLLRGLTILKKLHLEVIPSLDSEISSILNQRVFRLPVAAWIGIFPVKNVVEARRHFPSLQNVSAE